MQPPGTAEAGPLLTLVHHIPGCEFESATVRGAEVCVCGAGALQRYAEAYVNHGKWIADCVRPHCANAEKLNPGQTALHCTNCLQVAPVRWPADVAGITEALTVRPVPQTRNWAPAGHRQAVVCGFPEGQTVADLVAETNEQGEQ